MSWLGTYFCHQEKRNVIRNSEINTTYPSALGKTSSYEADSTWQEPTELGGDGACLCSRLSCLPPMTYGHVVTQIRA